jgi:group I intron endonuclease
MSGEIYKATSLSGKSYIGQTSRNTLLRWKEHLWDANKKNGGNCSVLNNAIRKYGWGNFIVEVLIKCDNSLLNFHENYFMNKFNSLNSKTGYNLREAGNSGKATVSTREKQSFAQMGEKNHNFGKPRSDKTKLLLSKINLEKAIRYSQIGDLLPKYVKYLKWGCREGYQIVSHPALGTNTTRGFTVKKDGNDGNLEKCLTCVRFMDTLIPGDKMNSDRLKNFRKTLK